MFQAGTRVCKGQVEEKMMALWRNERSVCLVSVIGRTERRQRQTKDIFRDEVWRYNEVWWGVDLRYRESHGKYLRFHYSEGNGKSGWVLSGVMTWNFHFGEITVNAAWQVHWENKTLGRRVLRILLWSIWEVTVVWTKTTSREVDRLACSVGNHCIANQHFPQLDVQDASCKGASPSAKH